MPLARAGDLGILFPALGSAREHLDEVVVEAIEKLALKGPLELRVVQVARMKLKVVGVHRHAWIFEANDHFHRLAAELRVEGEQRMLVKRELIQNTLQARICRCLHSAAILIYRCGTCCLCDFQHGFGSAIDGSFFAGGGPQFSFYFG